MSIGFLNFFNKNIDRADYTVVFEYFSDSHKTARQISVLY